MERGTKISIILTILFVGVPSIGSFYLPLLTDFVGWLPLDFIFTWMSRVGILTLGFTLGWYLRAGSETTDAERVDAIEGCIQKDGIAWKGTATLSRGQLVDYDLPYKPICPKCQTPMKKDTFEASIPQRRRNPSYSRSSQSKNIWACPNDDCGHAADRSAGKHDEAENLFERHIGRIVESEGEKYSLNDLIDRIDGKVTPRRIWEEYYKVTSEPHISTNCFH